MIVATKERPILFSGPMVRAIMERQKTQARRLIFKDGSPAEHHMPWRVGGTHWQDGDDPLCCPYGEVGDRLWVRESAWIAPPRFADIPSDNTHVDHEGRGRIVAYCADDKSGETARCAGDYKIKVTPSVHMPRWASRITAKITGVRVERLQEISEEDARDEGVQSHIDDLDGRAFDNFERSLCRRVKAMNPKATVTTKRAAFSVLWDSINGKTHPWASNPWVWVVTFNVPD